MIKKVKKSLKKIFHVVKNKTRMLILFFILFVLGMIYSQYLKAVFFVILFILIAGVSKFYHRFFKSSLGIDLVFFLTIIISLAYKNIFFSLLVAWLGLIIADSLGHKFSYTSLVSLAGLTMIVLIARVLPFTAIISAIILTLIFEIYSIIVYLILGSSFDRIILYLVSHLCFNLFLIFTISESLLSLMI